MVSLTKTNANTNIILIVVIIILIFFLLFSNTRNNIYESFIAKTPTPTPTIPQKCNPNPDCDKNLSDNFIYTHPKCKTKYCAGDASIINLQPTAKWKDNNKAIMILRTV